MKCFLLLIAAVVTGCQERPEPSPAIVRAADLARFYRDDPATAKVAYTGRPITLTLTNPVQVGNELHWHLSGGRFPAVVVCQFSDPLPKPAPLVCITGTCRGIVRDGHRREFSGFDFHVLIDGCRATRPSP